MLNIWRVLLILIETQSPTTSISKTHMPMSKLKLFHEISVDSRIVASLSHDRVGCIEDRFRNGVWSSAICLISLRRQRSSVRRSMLWRCKARQILHFRPLTESGSVHRKWKVARCAIIKCFVIKLAPLYSFCSIALLLLIAKLIELSQLITMDTLIHKSIIVDTFGGQSALCRTNLNHFSDLCRDRVLWRAESTLSFTKPRKAPLSERHFEACIQSLPLDHAKVEQLCLSQEKSFAKMLVLTLTWLYLI